MKKLKPKTAEKKRLFDSDIWPRIYQRLSPQWKLIVVAILLVTVVSATKPMLALIMQPLLDEGFSGDKPSYMWSIPLTVIALMFVRGVASFASDYLLALVANNMLRKMRTDMFERLLALPDIVFKRGDTGRLLNRFTIDAGTMTSVATEVITVLVRETITIVALIAVLLYMSWQLTLIVFVMLPISFLTARIVSIRLRRINRETVNMNAELVRVVGETIEGQRVVKLFDGYEREHNRFVYVNGRLRRFAMRAATANAALSPITQFFISLAVAGVIAMALYQASTQGLTIGSFAAFLGALAQLFDPIRRLTGIAGTTQRMMAAAESVFALIDFEVEPTAGKRSFSRAVQGHLEYTGVTHYFEGSDTPVINNLSFKAEPGQTVALVGRSGSGKTTLANMLPRFIIPTAGEIRIDGVDIQDVDLLSLRAQMSMVSQDVVLFEGSIRENVAYGVYAARTDDEVWAALEAANLADFIRSLPGGLAAPVGEKANMLSGGQRQRLAIARALIKDSPILILDEATSALDNESERQIQASLDILMQGKTTLVIAHRLTTIQKADLILVLDNGEIIEQGNHAQLLRLGGVYASLYQMQFLDEGIE
ncbi:lipid A export permease/ATP-binding protein MsbA [Paenalcaligenes niemegkensis]|uniref:lipid A export permease/ATP-binding protein MsbA n=1 Tax=Paenalcaligenes niemegkensis TaxID=2895469 RepID=UPI001EE9ACB4|nr:lipid A export permease/ATP-binding protein MsbA [Paenalcaligenes niemegkensis]MCQ9615614.1 lipid A export permease/ATP-binding protein MsbA [Paenalcaligenes niemegkensis]